MFLFNSGLFWFIQGVLVCLVIGGLRAWMADMQIPMPWWKWLLVGGWLVFVGMSIAYVGTSLGEGEPHAARMGGLFGGVLAVISAVILGRILRWR